MPGQDKTRWVRVYHSIQDDPLFEEVWANNDRLATWLRMLILADGTWPQAAPMPRESAALSYLCEVGLILPKPGQRYTVRGLDALREHKRASGRIGAAVRWQSDANAKGMPTRPDQTRPDQTSAIAMRKEEPTPRPRTNGSSPVAIRSGTHAGQHPDCMICHPELAELPGRPATGRPPLTPETPAPKNEEDAQP